MDASEAALARQAIIRAVGSEDRLAKTPYGFIGCFTKEEAVRIYDNLLQVIPNLPPKEIAFKPGPDGLFYMMFHEY